MTAHTTGFGDMDPEAFRREAHRVADWIADYLAGSERYPVLAQVRPGAITAALPSHAPDAGRILRRHLCRLRAGADPRHHALEPSRLLRLLLDHRQRARRSWRSSCPPRSTSRRCCGGRRRRRPSSKRSRSAGSGGCSACRTASKGSSTTRRRSPRCTRSRRRASERRPRSAREVWPAAATSRRCACTARTRRTRRSTRPSSCSVTGRSRSAGFPAMRTSACAPALLAAAIAEDRAAGWLPLAVVATVGTTSSTSIDPVPEIAECVSRVNRSGCTSMRRTRASPRWFRVTNGSSAAPSTPIRSSSIRTSGCSPRSISPRCIAGTWTWCAPRSR